MKEITIQKSQNIAIDILKKVADICDTYKLTYSLFYGTLIGAIRHNGYIPWDDDIDIIMPRPDFDKLIQLIKDNRSLIGDLQLFTSENSNYPYMIARVSDPRFMIKVDNEADYGMGVFIDIYPFDGMGKTKREARKIGFKGDLLSSMCFQATRNSFKIAHTTEIKKKFLKYPVYIISKILGVNFLKRQLINLSRQYSYNDSNFVGCVTWLSGGEKDIFKKEWLGEFKLHRFDKYEFYIPVKYDEILKHIYGDYMKLPPKNERIGHHDYKVYAK